MKRRNKKSCNRFDYGGIISQQISDLYKSKIGNGLPGTIEAGLTNNAFKEAKGLVDSAYNFNLVASNNEELLDIYDTYKGLNKIELASDITKDKDSWRDLTKNILYETQVGGSTGGSIGGPIGGLIGTLVGVGTGIVSAGVQADTLNSQVRDTNSYIALQNIRQSAANNNAATNLATRQKLGFESGYFRDGGDINYFNNGGTHEQNPFGGIPQGIGPNDKMNVVEEGEVKWESPDGDYIFSNHQRLNKQDVTDNLLPNNLTGKTIAGAAKKVLKESDERPYDYISNNGKEHYLGILRDINESKLPENKEINSFEQGGEEKKRTWYQPMLDSWSNWRYPTTWGATNLYNEVDLTAPSKPVTGLNLGKNINYFENSDLNSTINRINNTLSKYRFNILSDENESNKGGAKTKSNIQTTEPQQVVAPNEKPKKDLGKWNDVPPLSKNVNDAAMPKIATDRISKAEALEAIKNNNLKTPSVKSNNGSKSGLDSQKLGNILGSIGDVAMALAPAIAAVFDDPNYNFVNELRNSFRPVDTPYVSSANYMKYTPVDLDYILNQINRQSVANARNIMDLSGGNRATAMAGLFGNDLNTQTARGNATLQAALQNMQNYQNVQKHNTGINEFDINQYTTNARFNAQGLAQARQSAAMLGQQEFDAWRDREYANFLQALNNLQGIKKDRWTNDQIQMLVDSGAIAWDPRTGQYIIKNS